MYGLETLKNVLRYIASTFLIESACNTRNIFARGKHVHVNKNNVYVTGSSSYKITWISCSGLITHGIFSFVKHDKRIKVISTETDL